MLKPRIFVSAVTRELKTARQLVANTLIALGYEPVWQEIFETSSEDIRPLLRRAIDSCGAVLQIVGDAYGAEPPAADEQFGRCSYTQFEALYAAASHKRIYYLIAQPELPRDAAAEALDIPRDDSEAAQADAPERRRLQQVYRQRCQASEHIFYAVQTHPETELSVRRLKSELEQLRRGFRLWMAGVAVALLFLLGGLLWLNLGQQGQFQKLNETQQAVAENTEELRKLARQLDNPEQLRAALIRTITQTYDKALKAADTLPKWKEREQAKELAVSQRDQNLSRVEEFLNAILAEVRSGNASPEFLEMTRIFKQEGAEQAVAYILSRKKHLLADYERHQQESRQKFLVPLLEAVRHQVQLGDYAAAHTLCAELLTKDPAWGDALHEQGWIVTELGDRALRYESLTVAQNLRNEAARIAQRLAELAATHPHAQRDLMASHGTFGDVQLQLGNTKEALNHYEQTLAIRTRLAKADERDAQAQRDLWISFYNLGGVHQELLDWTAARKAYRAGIEVLKRMIGAGMYREQSLREKKILENELSLCDTLPVALGDWADLMKQPVEAQPVLLVLRITWLAKQGRRSDVEQVAAALLGLKPRELGNLYHAACAYGLCLKLSSGWSGRGDFPPSGGVPVGTEAEQALRSQYQRKALDALKAAIAAGYNNFQHMRADHDLRALHGLPEFEAVFPPNKP